MNEERPPHRVPHLYKEEQEQCDQDDCGEITEYAAATAGRWPATFTRTTWKRRNVLRSEREAGKPGG